MLHLLHTKKQQASVRKNYRQLRESLGRLQSTTIVTNNRNDVLTTHRGSSEHRALRTTRHNAAKTIRATVPDVGSAPTDIMMSYWYQRPNVTVAGAPFGHRRDPTFASTIVGKNGL